MPFHDFRCAEGHVHEALVHADDKEQSCPQCGKRALRVFLKAPRLDWMGMGASRHAGPEFIDRFEKAHKQRRNQEEAHVAEHGDKMRGAGS